MGFYVKPSVCGLPNLKLENVQSVYEAYEKGEVLDVDSAEYRPEVGDGATVSVGSDRYPATIIEVRKNGRVVIQMDNDKLVSGSDYTGDAVYEYSADKGGDEYLVYEHQKTGRYLVWGDKSRVVSLGYRRRYNDPSF